MTQQRKMVFVSSIAVPHQVKLCAALQDYFDAEFWFYETPDRTRGKWWSIELGDSCKIIPNVLFFKSGPLVGKYLAPNINKQLKKNNPDIVMLGGFSIPGNFIAYRWARKNGKKTIVFTERSRNKDGILRKRSIVWRLIRWWYRDLDLVITSADDAVAQFRDEFGFGEKVVAGRYAADLEAYFEHPLRKEKSAYTYLFANRMTEIYNPLGAIEIFARIVAKYPGSRLLMNAAGELDEQCRNKITDLHIENAVEFLTDIQSWNELHTVYAGSDVLIFPAHFSNGNFTILEAMASGMGVIVSDQVLGIGKMIDDGVNGFNCEPTVEAFVDRIEQYIRSPQLFEKYAMLNRPMVKPLSTKGTAKFFSELVRERLGI